MNSIKTLCAAAVLTATAPLAASAASLTIDFDGASGDGGEEINVMGDKSYHVDGYIMDPVNLQGGLCADGKCTIESTQTVEPTLYREDETNFDLLSFYFLNTGNGAIGEPAANFTTLSLYDTIDSVVARYSIDFGNELAFGDIEDDFPGLDITYFDGEGSDPGNIEECFLSTICKNYGYTIDLGELGLDIGRATWSSAGDANARLDDMVVRGPEIPPVPLPAAGWLLLGGLAGLGALRRRKTA